MAIKEKLFYIVCITFVFFLTYFTLPKHGEVMYNCTWVEISPDIPLKVKEECRKKLAERIK
jgi:hypothetical protein